MAYLAKLELSNPDEWDEMQPTKRTYPVAFTT